MKDLIEHVHPNHYKYVKCNTLETEFQYHAHSYSLFLDLSSAHLCYILPEIVRKTMASKTQEEEYEHVLNKEEDIQGYFFNFILQ